MLTAPIEANIEYSRVPGSSIFTEELLNPASVMRSSVDETYFSDMSPIFTQGMVPSFQYSATERLGVPPEHISHSSPSFTFFPTNWGLLDVMR